jgi:hypothetical protein
MDAQPSTPARFLHVDVPLALRDRCVEFAREAAAKETVREDRLSSHIAHHANRRNGCPRCGAAPT